MMRLNYSIVGSLLLIISLVSLGFLLIGEQTLSHLIVISILIVVVAIVGIVSLYTDYKARHTEDHRDTLDTILAAMGAHAEILFLSHERKVIWTTHPQLYQTLEDFVSIFSERIEDTPSHEDFKRLLAQFSSGSLILEKRMDPPHQIKQKLWVRMIPCDDGIVLVITELLLEDYERLKTDYRRLMHLFNELPLSLVYQDSRGLIVGMNKTFCDWVHMPREKLIGTRFLDFIEESEESETKLLQGQPIKILKALKAPGHPFILIKSEPCEHADHVSTSYTHAPIPTIIVTVEGKILQWNPAFQNMLGDKLPFEDSRDLIKLLHPAVRSETLTKLRRICENPHATVPFETRFDGDFLHTTTFINALPTVKKGGVPRLVIQFIDISEQKRLERQFIQSQKMQAVGQLAGGIAHDFNNLLTAMIGFSDLLLQRYTPNDPSYTDVMQIKQNASRATNLVRQLLAFSRQQTLQPKVINITDTLSELSILLRRLLGATVELNLVHERDLWPVMVDPSQLEQVIINMAVNARDAMANGGTLSIRTSNIRITDLQPDGNDLLAKGEYILIEVADSGHGIAPEHIEHIFEPFFSTKEIGSGTGLGLSTAYGIVKQTGGNITVESKIDLGTTFKIYLPRYQGDAVVESIEKETLSGDFTGRETIMLVEDEDAVRMFSARALREKGYNVIDVNSGDKALDILNQGQKIDLLITDVVMPKMDGPTLSKKVHHLFPNLKTIFISGYTEDTFRGSIDRSVRIHFLQKPFTLKELAAKVKTVLQMKD